MSAAVLLCTGGVLALTATGQAAGLAFDAPEQYQVGMFPTGSASADFNGDGAVDVVVANRNGGTITVYSNDGLGHLGGRQEISLPRPLNVATADFNNDGRQDIVALSHSTGSPFNSTGHVILGDGAGNFGPPVSFSIAQGRSAAAADFNSDGNTDLAIATETPGGLVLFGDGSGSFPSRTALHHSVPIDLSVKTFDVIAGDFNGDGHADAATANHITHQLAVQDKWNWVTTISFGDGAGGFSAPQPIGSDERNGYALHVRSGDVNRDGNPDLVSSAETGLQLSLANGNGTYVTSIIPGQLSGGGSDTDHEVIDYNNDGLQDIVFVNTGFDSIRFLAGTGDGSFVEDDSLHTGNSSSPRAPIIEDIDRDGRRDVAVAELPVDFQSQPGRLSVYRNLGSRPVVGAITVSPGGPVAVNTAISASATFTDGDAEDTHSAIWNWGDGTTSAGAIQPSGMVTGSHAYASPEVYTVTLTVTDSKNVSGTQSYQFISVYSATPQGLFSAGQNFTAPSTTVPRNLRNQEVRFGLSYRYQGEVPVDNRQFTLEFRDIDFSFNATSVSSLVISNGVGTLRGSGELNGQPNYTFLAVGSQANDTIRIQIKDPVGITVFDTQNGSADNAVPTAVVRGNVLAH